MSQKVPMLNVSLFPTFTFRIVAYARKTTAILIEKTVGYHFDCFCLTIRMSHDIAERFFRTFQQVSLVGETLAGLKTEL